MNSFHNAMRQLRKDVTKIKVIDNPFIRGEKQLVGVLKAKDSESLTHLAKLCKEARMGFYLLGSDNKVNIIVSIYKI